DIVQIAGMLSGPPLRIQDQRTFSTVSFQLTPEFLSVLKNERSGKKNLYNGCRSSVAGCRLNPLEGAFLNRQLATGNQQQVLAPQLVDWAVQVLVRERDISEAAAKWIVV